MGKQTFILEVDSDTNPAIFTTRLRGELNLFLGHGAFELCNAERTLNDADPDFHQWCLSNKQHLGDDPRVVRSNLHRVDL